MQQFYQLKGIYNECFVEIISVNDFDIFINAKLLFSKVFLRFKKSLSEAKSLKQSNKIKYSSRGFRIKQ